MHLLQLEQWLLIQSENDSFVSNLSMSYFAVYVVLIYLVTFSTDS
jgi:uncharacterized membrane protein (DUF485 family)